MMAKMKFSLLVHQKTASLREYPIQKRKLDGLARTGMAEHGLVSRAMGSSGSTDYMIRTKFLRGGFLSFLHFQELTFHRTATVSPGHAFSSGKN